MFVPEIEIKKFEMVDVIATSVEVDDCPYETECLGD